MIIYRLFVISIALVSMGVLATQSTYSKQELRALHQREQSAFSMSQTRPQQTLLSTVMSLSKKHEAEAKAMNKKGLSMIPHSKNETLKVSNVLIFTSLALPKTMFNQLVSEANTLQVPLLIRGVLPKGMRATMSALSSRLMGNKNKVILGGVSIDPVSFKQFGITHVPAFVVIKEGMCENRGIPCDKKYFDVLLGSLSLHNALELLASKGQFSQEILAVQNINSPR